VPLSEGNWRCSCPTHAEQALSVQVADAHSNKQVFSKMDAILHYHQTLPYLKGSVANNNLGGFTLVSFA
jgi:hypothetical protein